MAHRVGLFVAASVAGLVLVAWGWILQGREYLPGLLLEIGASLVLAVPLIALGRMTERRVRKTEERLEKVHDQIRQTSARLDSLGEITRQGLVDRHQQRESLLRDALRSPTSERLRVLLREAAMIGAIAPHGVRVRIPQTSRWLRFTADESITAHAEERDGTPITEVHWRDDESPADLVDRFPFDVEHVDELLRELTKAIRTALSARTGDSNLSLGKVIELANEQWAISADGLHCLQRYYHLHVDDLLDSRQDWRSHMLSMRWVDRDMFLDAYRTASTLLRPH